MSDAEKAVVWTSLATQLPDLDLVRTAAQAAMALKVHGILETTGMPSASARLQHASLPTFDKSHHNKDHGLDDSSQAATVATTGAASSAGFSTSGGDFEDGVINVDSCLRSSPVDLDDDQNSNNDDGYDLLPLPVPAPERRILCAGSSSPLPRQDESRFHYGTLSQQQRLLLDNLAQDGSVFGMLSVDDNVDKLRQVIGSVNKTLSKCLTSIGKTGKAELDRQAKQMEIVRGLDSWSGMRGKFVSQRSLMEGFVNIEQCKDVKDEGILALVDGTFGFTGLGDLDLSDSSLTQFDSRYFLASLLGFLRRGCRRRCPTSCARITYCN